MTIRDELVELQKRNGILRPDDAVAWAALHPKSELHGALEWDDTEAAQQYRIWQVRHLIAVHVVNEKGTRQILSLSIDRINAGGGYRSLDDIMSSAPLREVLLADALAELERVRLKYNSLVELARVWGEIRRAKTKLSKRAKSSTGGKAQRRGVSHSTVKQAKRGGSKLNHERPRPAMQA